MTELYVFYPKKNKRYVLEETSIKGRWALKEEEA